jgi:hypothetical protein
MTIEVDGPSVHTSLRPGETDEHVVMQSLVLELQAEFPDVPHEQVSVLVQCLWSHYDSAPVRDFVVLLVRKQAKEELFDHLGLRQDLTGWPVATPSPAPRMVFRQLR